MSEPRIDPAARAAFLVNIGEIMGGGKQLVFVIERDNLRQPRMQIAMTLQTQGPIELIAKGFDEAAAALRHARDVLDAEQKLAESEAP